jgi:hypothetical protein
MLRAPIKEICMFQLSNRSREASLQIIDEFDQ